MSDTPKKKLVLKLIPKKVMPEASKDLRLAKHVCVKVENLRKLGYGDLEEWMKDLNNRYVGRRGRIFITNPDTKERRIFHYQDDKWKNPYKLDIHALEDSLKLYREHLDNSGLINDIGDLKGKNLGCFCAQNAQCHAKMLAELANNS